MGNLGDTGIFVPWPDYNYTPKVNGFKGIRESVISIITGAAPFWYHSMMKERFFNRQTGRRSEPSPYPGAGRANLSQTARTVGRRNHKRKTVHKEVT